MKGIRKTYTQVKIWPFLVLGGLLLGGFIYWDFARHRQVEKAVAVSAEIPGAGVSGGLPVEYTSFREIRSSLTRGTVQGNIRIAVIWNTPGFFRALARVEGAQDIKRHETLYHAYDEKFGFLHDFVFTVILDSESVDLRAHGIKENSRLRNDKGTEVLSWHWVEGRDSSSRHLEGVLFFAQRTESGTPMIGHLIGEHLPGESPPKFLDLILKGLPGGQEAIFRWELPPATQETGS